MIYLVKGRGKYKEIEFDGKGGRYDPVTYKGNKVAYYEDESERGRLVRFLGKLYPGEEVAEW